MTIDKKVHVGRAWKSIILLLILGMVLVACAAPQAEQEPASGDPDVSEEAADVAQESEELAEATGEEIEEGAADAATAAAQAGEEIEPTIEQAGEEVGTAAAQAGEEVEEGAADAATAVTEAGEEIQEEVNLPQELTDVEGVTVSELDDNLDNYISQTVAVRGDVTEIIGANAFQLSDPSVLGGDEVLVVGTSVNTDTIDVENTVEVSGVVHSFDLVVIEEETGLDLDDDLFTEIDDDHAVIVAEEVVNIPGADD
jgi:hypothetical protein